MKNYPFIVSLTIVISVCNILKAQVLLPSRNGSPETFHASLQALQHTIENSKYIIEAAPLGCDVYYVAGEDQSYKRMFIKVIKVLRGNDLMDGDTLVGIWKLESKGKLDLTFRIDDIPQARLWFDDYQSMSCLFLRDSPYPVEREQDIWSSKKKVTYILSDMGGGYGQYMEGLYTDLEGYKDMAVSFFVANLFYKTRADWYNYLKQYPDIKVPEGY